MMAKRPVFVVGERRSGPVQIHMIEFQWFPGFSLVQKQRSIASLHQQADAAGLGPVLEASRRSPVELGEELSAFNMRFRSLAAGQTISVEEAFQGSKVFRDGGPYVDMLGRGPHEAKKDPRLKESGPLIGFRYHNEDWELNPPTAFYDWLYVNAILTNRRIANDIREFSAFTDIEFNPKKSKNCQAHAVAMAVWALRGGLSHTIPTSKEEFLTTFGPYYESSGYSAILGWGER